MRVEGEYLKDKNKKQENINFQNIIGLEFHARFIIIF